MKHTTLLLAGIALVTAATAIGAQPVAAATTANNHATVKIQEDATNPNGTLTLEQAPSFDHGTVKATDIYDGFKNQSAKSDTPLTVVDGRSANITEKWTLSARLAPFTDQANAKATLNQSTLRLKTLDTAANLQAAGTLTSTAVAPTKIATQGDSRGTQTIAAGQLEATLDQAGTPTAVVKNDSLFQAALTWSLTPDIAPAAAL